MTNGTRVSSRTARHGTVIAEDTSRPKYEMISYVIMWDDGSTTSELHNDLSQISPDGGHRDA